MSKLSIVGIGPGSREDMTLRADRVLGECELIVGYTVYVELVRPWYPDKEYLSTPMTKEIDRCRMALDAARGGKRTALVCSGDTGIYGLAALLLQLRGEESEPEVEIIPGLTAAGSGGALLGAPLTHDFAAVSLSDRLTDWGDIEVRLDAAARSGMAIVLYNPVSRSRPDHLRKACEILLRHLPAETVCGVARSIGRAGEETHLTTLGALGGEAADMFSTVFVGTRRTRVIGGRMVTPRGYWDV